MKRKDELDNEKVFYDCIVAELVNKMRVQVFCNQ